MFIRSLHEVAHDFEDIFVLGESLIPHCSYHFAKPNYKLFFAIIIY